MCQAQCAIGGTIGVLAQYSEYIIKMRTFVKNVHRFLIRSSNSGVCPDITYWTISQLSFLFCFLIIPD
jgi:hypothetical protein